MTECVVDHAERVEALHGRNKTHHAVCYTRMPAEMFA